MILNKKLKWTLGLIGLTAITAISMSPVLISCSKNNSVDVNKPLGHTYEEWIKNLQNKNEPVFGVDSNNWNQIHNLYSKLQNNEFLPQPNEINLFDNSDLALEKSKSFFC